ncbi:Uncharacterised protein [uncultured archaeon]|nr:Uncharacterised protein [uncultured archaeon]
MKFYTIVLALFALTFMVFAVDNSTGNVTVTPSPTDVPNATITPSITPNFTGNFTCAPFKFMIPQGPRSGAYEGYCLTIQGGLVHDQAGNEWCCAAKNNQKGEENNTRKDDRNPNDNFTCAPYKFVIPQNAGKQKYETACTNQNGTIKNRTLPNNETQEWCCNTILHKQEQKNQTLGDLQGIIKNLQAQIRDLQAKLAMCLIGSKNGRGSGSRKDFNSSNETGSNDSTLGLPEGQLRIRPSINPPGSEDHGSGNGGQGSGDQNQGPGSGGDHKPNGRG